MSSPAPLICPVCQARFRETVQCSRCGADLAPLMRLAAAAGLLRQAAFQAQLAGQFPLADQLVQRAAQWHATPSERSSIRHAGQGQISRK
jgi:predicted amidophosphoribosyltransferase